MLPTCHSFTARLSPHILTRHTRQARTHPHSFTSEQMAALLRRSSHPTLGTATRTPWSEATGSSTPVAADVKAPITGLNALPEAKCEVFVCPPTAYLSQVQDSPSTTASAQNCYSQNAGAFTGETGVGMLQDMGVEQTLIGHSERRDIFGEEDALLGEKIAHCQAEGLNVCACIGEHLEDREAGRTMDVLKPQLQAIADNVTDWSR